MWIDEVQAELSKVYGKEGAKQVARNIIPSCIADFRKLLTSSKPGETVKEPDTVSACGLGGYGIGSERTKSDDESVLIKEKYKTEDGRVILLFTGVSSRAGGKLLSVNVNDREIDADIEL